jgi:3-dehydroquinate synthase
MRGVEVIHIPTTLLAAVDAAIGGKTGVNHGGKNLVGVFWDPTRVAIDLDTLESLPRGLLLEGMAEVIKAGFIGDPGLVDLVDSHGLSAPLDLVVPAAIRVKASYVIDDPQERGKRAMLNFGHTIGHAVEFASSMSHGFAIGIGMVAASAVSTHMLGFTDEDRVVEVIANLGLPTTVGSLDRDRISDLLVQDKKRDGQGLRMVLLASLGDPALHHVDGDAIDVGLSAIGL